MRGATCRKNPISRSALEKNPMPGHLFEGSPVDEGTTRRGTDTPVQLLEKPTGSTYSSTRGQSPREQHERQAEFCREQAYCILSAYCILHIECSSFHSIFFQDLE